MADIPEFGTLQKWCELTGMGRSTVYALLAAGHIRGVKLGRRLLVDFTSGLRYMRALPSAKIRPRTTPRRRSTAIPPPGPHLPDVVTEDVVLASFQPLPEAQDAPDTTAEASPTLKRRSRGRPLAPAAAAKAKREALAATEVPTTAADEPAPIPRRRRTA